MSSCPSKRTEPFAWAMSPMSARQSVVLPMPLRPMTATGSRPISKLTPWRPGAAGEARRRLVEHHDLRVAGARHPHLELALLAVGERADDGSELIFEPD